MEDCVINLKDYNKIFRTSDKGIAKFINIVEIETGQLIASIPLALEGEIIINKKYEVFDTTEK